MSQVFFVVYAPDTGKILRTGMCPDFLVNAQASSMQAVLLSNGPITEQSHYISSGRVLAKQALPNFDKTTVVANGTDVVTCAGLPNLTHVDIDGDADQIVTDGSLELTFSTPGFYNVTLDGGVAYAIKKVTIHAT